MIIEHLTFDEILAEIKAKLPSEITLLESDPATKIPEIVEFREMILRERINNVAKANLLALRRRTKLISSGASTDIRRERGTIVCMLQS